REDRVELREGFAARVAPRVLVLADDRLATLRIRDRDRRHLGVETTAIERLVRALVAREGEVVLIGASHLVLDRDALGVRAHVAVLDGAPQAIGDGRVDEPGVAE